MQVLAILLVMLVVSWGVVETLTAAAVRSVIN